jgi:hypothetical protein
MKKHSTKSGKATNASPQQITPATVQPTPARIENTGLIGTISAHGECLNGFAAFLDKCDNIDDMENMALVFRAYQNEHKAGGWVGEGLANVLLDVGVRLKAGDDQEDISSLLDGCPDSKYSPASSISFRLKGLLETREDADLEFLATLLEAMATKLSAREAVTIFVKNLDAPKSATSRRERVKGSKKAS